MSKEIIRIECLFEIFEDIGLTATEEQVKQISEDYALHLEMENEMETYQHIGIEESCGKCASLKTEVVTHIREINVYKDSVKKRRSASNVWIENGDVLYD